MKKLKNQLIIFLLLIFIVVKSDSFAAENILPHTNITGISQNLELITKKNEERISLVNIYTPSEFLAPAINTLKKLSINKDFAVKYNTQKYNRHGNLNATLLHNNISLQEELISRGLALVYFTEGNELATSFFLKEEQARNNKHGIWKHIFRTTNSTDITEYYNTHLNHFIIIEGAVENTYLSKKNLYINFGKDWKTDFTVGIAKNITKDHPEVIAEIRQGTKLRVRGWLEEYNGPFIRITNLANIEIL